MTEADVLAKVEEILLDYLGADLDEVTPEATIVDDLGADSLDVLELQMAVEEQFGITIPDEDVEQLTTVQALVDYILKRLGG